MTTSWRALPIPNTDVSLKAPTLREFRRQQSPSWKPRRSTAEEVLVAETLIEAIDAEDIRIPQGKAYRVWRYPQGLAVQTPEGWTVYKPLEGQIRRGKEARSFTGQGRSRDNDSSH